MAERISYSKSHIQRVVDDTGLSFLTQIGTRRGSVLVAEYRKQHVAVKIADMTSGETEAGLDLPRSVGIRNEARILTKIPDLIGPKVLEYKEYSDMSYLITEYLGNLDTGKKTLFHLPDPTIGVMTVGDTVERLHSAGIIHGDIQPENILFYEADGGGIQSRLIDFEHARKIDEPAHGHSGLYHYLTPENAQILADKGIVSTVMQDDVFALIASCLAMITRTYPVSYSMPDLERDQRLEEIAQFRLYSTLGAIAEHMYLAQNLKNILRLSQTQRPSSIDSFRKTLLASVQDVA